MLIPWIEDSGKEVLRHRGIDIVWNEEQCAVAAGVRNACAAVVVVEAVGLDVVVDCGVVGVLTPVSVVDGESDVVCAGLLGCALRSAAALDELLAVIPECGVVEFGGECSIVCFEVYTILEVAVGLLVECGYR